MHTDATNTTNVVTLDSCLQSYASAVCMSSTVPDIVNLLDDEDGESTSVPTTAVIHSTSSAFGGTDPFLITDVSGHTFPTYLALRNYLDQYATQCGFEIRYPSNKGVPDQAGHAGTARCWCYLPPPVTLKSEEQQHQSHPPQRSVIPRARNRSGNQVKCSCPWRINFSRHVTGEYVFTSTRNLLHVGHDCVGLTQLTTTIDSLRVVPDVIRDDVRTAVMSGWHGTESLRRFLSTKHQLDIHRTTFANLVHSTKSELGIMDAEADFTAFLAWLQAEMLSNMSVARINIDSSATVSCIYYMSAEMVHHSRRNCQVLLMDTTFSTNRFSWPLCLLCGMDQHGHTVLFGVAMLRYQTTDAFEWVLQQLRSIMSDEVWQSVACVFTDGDQAMGAALAAVMPHSKHLRCRYHLEQNLLGKLHKLGVDPITSKQCVEQWKAAAHCTTDSDFNNAIAALTAEYPRIQPYITSTFPDAHTYADYVLNHINTLGIRSTARVESWNATLKGMLEVNSRTPLTVLFETLRYAVSDKDARAARTALEDAARRLPVSQARTVEAEMSPHITYYAQNIVSAQARLTLNYKYNMVQAANPAVFEVHDRRESVRELVRIVTVTDSSMHCTCGFPTTYLLPCRHVLVINSHIFATPFRPSQVGQRWLRAYMPGISAPTALDFSPHLDAADDVPAFSSAVASSSIDMPGRGARVGQIGGWCSTIVSIAGAHAHLYSYIARKVEGLCREFEALVSQPAVSGTGKRTKPNSANAALFSTSSPLHPTVNVEDMQMPAHRKRQRGSAKDKRQRSVVETAAQAMRTSMSISASQST
jgi:hypothetical protein